jgi:hypothetical protein
MNRTERVDAKSFFADFLLPLKRANMQKNIQYLDHVRPRDSYWGKTVSRTNGLEQLSTIGDATSLFEALGTFWEMQNDRNLCKLLPYLLVLRVEISGSISADDERETPPVEFVYPLF